MNWVGIDELVEKCAKMMCIGYRREMLLTRGARSVSHDEESAAAGWGGAGRGGGVGVGMRGEGRRLTGSH